MTDNIARQPKGLPTGGQFAHTSHSEPDIALASGRRPELAGWPESLPEPEVTLGLTEQGGISTRVNVAGELAFEAWSSEDDVNSAESGGWVNAAVPDGPVAEQAEAWVRRKHEEMSWDMRRELAAAFDRSRPGIVAQATGEPQPLDEDGLQKLIDANAQARAAADRDLELASASLAATKILAEHPDARYAEILTDSWDNGEFVSGARVVDADGRELHAYEDYNEPEGGDGTTPMELLRNLSANPAQSHWAGAFSGGSYGDEMYKLDLRKAAAWTPGVGA